MAKILVADDNSNIQRMVGLALKDQGIDVVAVGNGEAAVRKISDIRPDLVLADVFMPVRNGYEVCKYVKDDSTLAHIPVILLVGAFDPLDEQEAQRVGADGVLKKPFVPPDPLISMVKSALARAGVPLNGERAEAPKAAPAPPPPPMPAEAPRSVNAPTSFGLVPELAEQSFVEEVSVRPPVLNVETANQPVAFDSLLGTEEVAEDPGHIPPMRPELATERDWKSSDQAEAEEEDGGEESRASWRPDVADETFAGESQPAKVHDWRESLGENERSTERVSKHWTPTKEKTDFVEAAETQTPAYAADAWSAAISGGTQESAVAVKEEPRTAKTAVVEEAPAVPPAPAQEIEEKAGSSAQDAVAEAAPAVAQPNEAKPESSSWLSIPPSPWDAEARKASQMAATWDAPVVARIPNTAPAVEEPQAEVPAAVPYTASVDETQELPAETVEAIREEALQVAEEAVHEAAVQETAVQEAPTAEKKSEPEPAAEFNMDEMVARVLSKLSPEVLQAVTREILKPVIESIVRDEINAKK